jgi:hypothetical protein
LPPGWNVVAETNLFAPVVVIQICDVGAVVDGDGVPGAAADGDDAPVSDATVEESSGGDGWGLFASPAGIARGCPGGEALHKCGCFRVQPARFTLGATLARVALGAGLSPLTTVTTLARVALGAGLSPLTTVTTLARVALGAGLSTFTTFSRFTLHRYRRRNRALRTGGGDRRQIQRLPRANINTRVR